MIDHRRHGLRRDHPEPGYRRYECGRRVCRTTAPGEDDGALKLRSPAVRTARRAPARLDQPPPERDFRESSDSGPSGRIGLPSYDRRTTAQTTLTTPASTPAARGIAAAALGLFADTDPRRVTIRQIADAADVSVGSVYACYGSKDGLYLAVLSNALTLSARYTLNRKWSASPLQRVFNVGEAYVRFASENPEAFRVIVQRAAVDTSVPEIARAEARVARQIEQEVSAISADIQAAMDEGEILTLPVNEVFAYLWGSWVGVLGLMVRDDRFKISADEAHRILTAAQHVLARGLRPDSAS